MNNLVLFDDARQISLLPLTYTKPVSELRLGILTLREKWEQWLNSPASWLTRQYLREKYPLRGADDNLFINSGLLPGDAIMAQISKLKKGEALTDGETILAARAGDFKEIASEHITKTQFEGQYQEIRYPYHLFTQNAQELSKDFQLLTKERTAYKLNHTNGILKEDNLFVEADTDIHFTTINAATGPVYIGKNVRIMEGAHIRGPVALLDKSTVKMGAKIYGGTTIGPVSKVAGEIKNTIIQGNSNKAHEGYLGDAFIGEWCNLGADTNNSNLKNNYAEVKLWDYAEESFLKTGLTFCGLIMGDHSKAAINTMFNTGTVVGVSANIFGPGFPRNFIPSYSWGGSHGFKTYRINKAFEVAEKVMQRKGKTFDETEMRILEKIFELSAKYRK